MEDADSLSTAQLSTAQRELKDKAIASNLGTAVLPGWNEEDALLKIDYPEARDIRSVHYDEDEAAALVAADIDLSEVRFIPDVAGFFFTGTGRIEAQIRTRQPNVLRSIPGVQTDPSGTPDDSAGEGDPESFSTRGQRWSLTVSRQDVSLSLSSPSEQFRAVMAVGGAWRPPIPTLTIDGARHKTTAEAADVLARLADAFFFDLDVRYGVSLELLPRHGRRRALRPDRLDAPPDFPSNRYHPQPVALYRYGRSAVGLPLLSFLAYYQVLEFFFPIFTQEEITRRVRQALVSPRFDANDEVSLLQIINVVRPNFGGVTGEKDQLRATVRRCMTPELIESIVNASDQTKEYFCGRRQAVKGLSPLNLNGGADVRDQVADRMYDLRCRVVHTKSDGGDGAVELLLPSSKEAQSIGPDIELARVAAQEAIIAACSPLELG